MDQNHFSNFGRGSYKEHFYESILKLGYWPTRRCRYKFFFSIFSSGGHFMQPSRTILANLVDSYPRNISLKLFENLSIGLGVDVIKRFLALEDILFIAMK